jgi:HAD superfamily hydrolase (TIGR01509 family)
VDGTLLDSEENYYQADRLLLERRGIAFSRDDKRRYIGSSLREMMADFRRRFGLSESVGELVEEKNSLYLEIAGTDTRLFPEMVRFLDLVQEEGLPVACASGSSPRVLERVLGASGLAKKVDVVVSAEEVSHGKPAPDIHVEAARRLGVAPHQCLSVEDSAPGVESAKRALTLCLAVPFLTEKPLADAFLMADLVVEDGMSAFSADAALDWLRSWSGSPVSRSAPASVRT